MLWSLREWALNREFVVLLLWQLRQNVPAGIHAEFPRLVIELLHVVFGPFRMKLAAEPCGPLGSAVVFEAWQSEQVIRLDVVQGATILFVLPRLFVAAARTGWNEPAVSPLCQFAVPVLL